MRNHIATTSLSLSKAVLKLALSILIVSTICLPTSRIPTAELSCSGEGKCPMARLTQDSGPEGGENHRG